MTNSKTAPFVNPYAEDLYGEETISVIERLERTIANLQYQQKQGIGVMFDDFDNLEDILNYLKKNSIANSVEKDNGFPLGIDLDCVTPEEIEAERTALVGGMN
tara:strand:- start:635 stop:943 length:309 start_codon:yes stop_codon:yes gene_type:complete